MKGIEVETNNLLAQKKNTRMQPCQQLESYSTLSYSSTRPRVQQSVTASLEPTKGLGTSRRMNKAQSFLLRNSQHSRRGRCIVSDTKWRVLQQLREVCHFLEEWEGFTEGGPLGITEERGYRCASAGLRGRQPGVAHLLLWFCLKSYWFIFRKIKQGVRGVTCNMSHLVLDPCWGRSQGDSVFC